MALLGATKHVLGWFAPYWRRRWKGISLVMLVTVLSIALTTTYPIIFKYVIDSLSEGQSTGDVQFYVWLILLVGLARTITRWILPSTRYVMNLVLGMDIKLFHFENLLKKDPAFFNAFRSGDIITRFSDDIDGDVKLAWFGNSGIMRPVEAGFTLLFSIGVMMTLHWKLTLLAVSPLPLIVWAMSKTEHMQHEAYKKRQQTISQTNNILESAFSGIRIVIGFVMEQAQEHLFHANMVERKNAEERVVFIRSFLESLGSLINQIGLVVILFLGGYYVIHDEITLGTFYAFIAYMAGITEPIWTISWFFVSLKMAESSVDRLEEIERFENKPKHDNVVELPINQLRVKNVHFRFPDEEVDIIKGLNIVGQPGEKIGIVGEVGSGKTVLLKLISGWFAPSRGSVEVNDLSIHDLSDASRAQIIGYVPQDIELFSGDVTENIRMGREASRSLDSIVQSAVIGGELDLDKVLEQGGVGLSGGQRARVALARAFYGDTPIYIYDDVTSALDLNTEKILWQNIKQEYSNALFLVATHREATAEEMDRVLWIKDGKVYEEGLHIDLLRLHPEYRSLFAHD